MALLRHLHPDRVGAILALLEALGSPQDETRILLTSGIPVRHGEVDAMGRPAVDGQGSQVLHLQAWN